MASPAALASEAGLGVEEGLALGTGTPRGWLVVGEALDTPAGEARLPLADARCFFATARAIKVARMLAAASVAAVDATADELADIRAACARAAGWSRGSGAGSSAGPNRVCEVGRGDPLATQPAGRTGALEKSSLGRRGSACCNANAAGDGAIFGADLKPDSPESDGLCDTRSFCGGSILRLNVEMNPAMLAKAWPLLSTNSRNSAMRLCTANLRGMLSHGTVTRILPSLASCLGFANLTSELSTTTVIGHSSSVPGRRGHHGKLRRVLCHDQVPATALLPISSAFLNMVTPSLAVITALAIFVAASEGTTSAGG